MAIKDGVTPTGSERAKLARITPSDIDDAKRQGNRDGGDQGRRMFAAARDDTGADGPISDEVTQ